MSARKTARDSSIPKQLLKNRGAIECNFVFSLWKDSSLYEDYEPLIDPDTDLISEDGKFYYNVLHGAYDLGFDVMDNMVITSYLMDRASVKTEFDKRGGYRTVAEILDTIQTDNIDGYYDELVKSNMLINLHRYGFNVLDNLEHYQSLNSEQIYDEIEFFLADTCVANVEKLQAENLSEGYEPYIQQWDTGFMRGIRVGYDILDDRLMGVHKKNLLLHMAHIGNGKTTSAIQFYILPAIEEGENVCIIANEQDVSEFRQMILSTIVCGKFNYRGIDRAKFLQGGFNEEQRAMMNRAQNWLLSQPGKISMVETRDYSIKNVQKIVKKYSKKNYSLIIFDTLKPTVESTDKAWAEFSEVAKQLFLLAKKCDVAIVATAQLSSDSMSRRYLDLSCVGKSRAIAETATQVVMFRSVSQKEIDEGKIKAFIYEETPPDTYEKRMREIPLSSDKEYIVLFTPKNRFGSIGPPLIYERNMDYNYFHEIGYTNVEYDGYSKRG